MAARRDAQGAASGPSEAARASDGGRIDELDRLRLENLHLRQQALQQQLVLLTQQFLNGAEPRALQGRIDALVDDLNVAAGHLFTRHGLDPREYQLNIESGSFVPRRG